MPSSAQATGPEIESRLRAENARLRAALGKPKDQELAEARVELARLKHAHACLVRERASRVEEAQRERKELMNAVPLLRRAANAPIGDGLRHDIKAFLHAHIAAGGCAS